MRAPIERVAAHIRRWFAGHANLRQHPTVLRHVPHRVVAVIGAPQRVVRRDIDAMRAHEQALAPGAQEPPLAVEHHHRVRAAVKDKNVVAAVDPDRGDLAIGPARGQGAPVLDHLIPVRAVADYFRHDRTLPGYKPSLDTTPALIQPLHRVPIRASSRPFPAGGEGIDPGYAHPPSRSAARSRPWADTSQRETHMPLYETVLIARNDVTQQQVEQIADDIATDLTTEGGEIKKREYWGLRGLAYRI